MLVIGDEILSGRTQDANAHHLAGVMAELGIRLAEIRVISDDHTVIVEAVLALRTRYDYVFTSGGIGPTHDDITADAVAAAFGVPIDIRDDARAILLDYYGAGEITDARLRMARIPEGADLIDNPVSRAPGFRIGNVHVMAGVPVIFREMLAGVRSTLKGGPPTLSHSFRAQVAEGEIAKPLGEIAERHSAVAIGIYPYYRKGAGCSVILRATDEAALATAAREVRTMFGLFGVAASEEASDSGGRLQETP
ncbi:MAG: competence/damage-inducible protein A [Pseudomonadota bacterium]